MNNLSRPQTDTSLADSKRRQDHVEAISDESWVPATVSGRLLGMCISKWHAAVANAARDIAVGKPAAPQPVIRAHRFTRWRLGDIRRYQAELAEYAARSGQGSDVLARTANARAAAAAKKRSVQGKQSVEA